MPCKSWAVHDTDPPRCSSHGGGRTSTGAPTGNNNARKHGFYAASSKAPSTIEDVFDDLAKKQATLSEFIDSKLDDMEIPELATLLGLHAQTASRLGRLLRDKRAISGDAADGISGALAQALAELGTALGGDFVGEDSI